ncbi:DUF3037 domain-containing protein [Anoxybacillus sp. ST4]|uniref:DUF3037 domain-containing protein n=1 Tax=Anoxybacillus sp. ST4 TaxID=2864181 RepID=UPI001C63C7D7|nr:DUF3037 domain-containing protein [Anoxybacillus sp. ST4]MBW7651549.1 DUF3037 domain-containing protein [Anoxybacillus sp. ST4]
MDRQKNWYSVIQYVPNQIRGEVINVGLMLHAPEIGKLRYTLLDITNIKLRCLLANDVLLDTYRVQKDYIEYMLKTLPSNGTLFDSGKYTNAFLEELNNKLPNEFRLSEPTFSKTNNPDQLFQSLLENYIGKEFLSCDEKISHINTKNYIKKYFDELNLIGTKVKQNARFKPIKDINSIHFIIDFVYKNGVINLLQVAPSNRERLNDWFTKLITILGSYQQEAGIYLFYNQEDLNNRDQTLFDMLRYLESKDERVKKLEIHSKEFKELGTKIEKEGKYIEEFEEELAV